MIRGDLPAGLIGGWDDVGWVVAGEVAFALAAVRLAAGVGLLDPDASPAAAAPHPATSTANIASAAARRMACSGEPGPRDPDCLILTSSKSSGHCGASHADLPKDRPIRRARARP